MKKKIYAPIPEPTENPHGNKFIAPPELDKDGKKIVYGAPAEQVLLPKTPFLPAPALPTIVVNKVYAPAPQSTE